MIRTNKERKRRMGTERKLLIEMKKDDKQRIRERKGNRISKCFCSSKIYIGI